MCPRGAVDSLRQRRGGETSPSFLTSGSFRAQDPRSSPLPGALVPCFSPGDRHRAIQCHTKPTPRPQCGFIRSQAALPSPATHAHAGFKDTAPRFDYPATGLTATPCLVPREMPNVASRLSSVNKQQVYLLRALDLPKAGTGPQSTL